jgi:hypothetical protein
MSSARIFLARKTPRKEPMKTTRIFARSLPVLLLFAAAVPARAD